MAGRFFCEKPPRFLCASMWKIAFCCTFPPLFIPLPLSAFHLFPRRLHPVLSLLSFLPQSLNLFLTFSTRFSTVSASCFLLSTFSQKISRFFQGSIFAFFPSSCAFLSILTNPPPLLLLLFFWFFLSFPFHHWKAWFENQIAKTFCSQKIKDLQPG